MTTDKVEDDNTAFVVFVPKNGSDTTVESCLRLGAGPHAGATQDETTTYNDVVSKADSLSHLSAAYNAKSGIALLTPGTINMLAAGGVNTTCGSFTSNSIGSGTTGGVVASANSTIGSSYTVTIDPSSSHIISASYTSNDDGAWGTSSFNKAVTVSCNTVPLQASILFGASYAVSGPLVLQNNYGLIWNSTVGFNITAMLGRTTAFGTHTIVTTDLDGSNNAYFTKAQGSTAGESFKWTVPTKAKFMAYDGTQSGICKFIEGAAVVADAVAVVYAIVGAGLANNASAGTVQTWLKGLEPVAIACTALNGILAAVGLGLGFYVDDQTADESPNNAEATTFVIKDGVIELTTKMSPFHDPPLDPPPDPTNANLKLERIEGGGRITLTTGQGASITLDGNSIKIEAVTVTISGTKVTINQGGPNFGNAGAGDLAPGAIPGRPGGTAVV